MTQQDCPATIGWTMNYARSATTARAYSRLGDESIIVGYAVCLLVESKILSPDILQVKYSALAARRISSRGLGLVRKEWSGFATSVSRSWLRVTRTRMRTTVGPSSPLYPRLSLLISLETNHVRSTFPSTLSLRSQRLISLVVRTNPSACFQ